MNGLCAVYRPWMAALQSWHCMQRGSLVTQTTMNERKGTLLNVHGQSVWPKTEHEDLLVPKLAAWERCRAAG